MKIKAVLYIVWTDVNPMFPCGSFPDLFGIPWSEHQRDLHTISRFIDIRGIRKGMARSQNGVRYLKAKTRICTGGWMDILCVPHRGSNQPLVMIYHCPRTPPTVTLPTYVYTYTRYSSSWECSWWQFPSSLIHITKYIFFFLYNLW